jgi:HAD superfamily hydrolase (TIGR01509 family)
MRRSEIRAIAFDLGGVVVRNRYEKPILRNAAKVLGTSPRKLRTIIRMEVGPLERGDKDDLQFWSVICRRLDRPVPSSRVLKSLWSHQYERNLHFNEAVRKLVLSLKRQYPVIAISNTIPVHMSVNRRRGVFDLFDSALLSAEIGMRKPDREIFECASHTVKVPARNILFIDDDERWVRAARRCGLCAVRFTSVRGLKKQLKRYHVQLSSGPRARMRVPPET